MISYQVKNFQGESIDEICVNVFGNYEPSQWKMIMDLNPGIADFGDTIPMGYSIVLPEALKSKKVISKIDIWN